MKHELKGWRNVTKLSPISNQPKIFSLFAHTNNRKHMYHVHHVHVDTILMYIMYMLIQYSCTHVHCTCVQRESYDIIMVRVMYGGNGLG